MSFLKNLSLFLDECRLYNRKSFTAYQWEYIKKVLESHQYMTEFLGQFGGAFFDRLYDASVLRHEGLINHTHDKRYNSQKMQVLGAIKTLVQEASGEDTPWSFDDNLLASGYYRELLLRWDEVAADELLSDYVNFLFDEFEKGHSSVAYWVVSVIVWAGRAVPKEPFLAALRDSQKAYDPRSNQVAYENQTYSCMIGLEDRISHFYSYLCHKEALPLEEQSLAYRYIHVVIGPFIDPCAEHGFKPSPLLYGLYLKARFDSYTLIEEQIQAPFLKISPESYCALKEQYAVKSAMVFKNAIISRFGACHGLELRFSDCRDREWAPFYDLFLAMQNEEGLIIINEDSIQAEFANKFDKYCHVFCDEVLVDDYIAPKVEQFGLESCITLRERLSRKLILPKSKAMMSPEEVCLRLQQLTCLTHDWLEMLRYFPAVNLFAVLESWVEEDKAQVIPIDELAHELEKNLPLIEKLEKNFFNNSMHSMLREQLAYADYCYVSNELLNHIHQQLFMPSLVIDGHSINLREALENGTIIFAQDSLTAKYLDNWLLAAGIQLHSVYYDYQGELGLHVTTVGENLSFISELIQLGFDQTFKKLSRSCPELINGGIQLPGFADDVSDFSSMRRGILECLGSRPMTSSVAYYFNNGGALWPYLVPNHCQDAFYHGLIKGNLVFINACLSVTSIVQILQLQQDGKTKPIIEAAVQSRDPGVWAWFDRNFSRYYDLIEKTQPLSRHPVLLTLKLLNPSWSELNMILRKFPDFFKKFIEKKNRRYPSKGVEVFFESLWEPLSYSIANNPQAASALIKFPCYQEYLFDCRNFLITNYIEQALKFSHIEGAAVLVDDLFEHVSQPQEGMAVVYEESIKKIHDIFDKVIMPMITSDCRKDKKTTFNALQELYKKIEKIAAPYDFENWIERSLRLIGSDIASLKKKIELLEINQDSLFLKKAINCLWLKIESSKENTCILQLTSLLSCGVWPEGVDKKLVVRELLKIGSPKHLIDILKLCQESEPSLIAVIFECFADDSMLNFNFLEKALVKALCEKRLAIGEFYQLSALIEQYAGIKNYLFLLTSHAWAYLWSFQKHKEELAISLLSFLLRIEVADAHFLTQEISALKINQEANFWSILQSSESSLPADRTILLLFAIKKANQTLHIKKKPCVLVEAVSLKQFDFASYYVDKYHSVSEVNHINQLAFNDFMLSFDVDIVSWVISMPHYKEILSQAWFTHAKRTLLQEFLNVATIILNFALTNDLLTPEKAFQLWRVCQDYSKSEAAIFLESFISRCGSPSLIENFELKKNASSRVAGNTDRSIIFSSSSQANTAPTHKRRRKNSKEYYIDT